MKDLTEKQVGFVGLGAAALCGVALSNYKHRKAEKARRRFENAKNKVEARADEALALINRKVIDLGGSDAIRDSLVEVKSAVYKLRHTALVAIERSYNENK